MSAGAAQSFVPGRVVAGGDLRNLAEISQNEAFSVRFLRGPFEEHEGESRSIALIEGAEPGREIDLLARVASLLSTPIERGKAVVDLDYLMTYGGLSDFAYQLGLAGRSLVEGFQRRPYSGQSDSPDANLPATRPSVHDGYQAAGTKNQYNPTQYASSPLSRYAHQFLLPCNRSGRPAKPVRPIAIIDSGLAPSYCRAGRIDSIIDLSQGMPQMLTLGNSVDPVGHGTRVVRIVDRAAGNPRTKFIIASLGAQENVTSSAVAMAMTCCVDGIPNMQRPRSEMPLVVTMSLWPSVEGIGSLHQPLLVPFIAARYPAVTFLMAAGNDGEYFEVDRGASNLLYGAALDNRGHVPKYCSIPNDPLRTLATFGGCESAAFFDGPHAFGTSWATPVLAAALDAALNETNVDFENPPLPYDEIRRHSLSHSFSMGNLGWEPDRHFNQFRR
ncbi:MAG: S8/S53 family peptidase [Pirellulales bacterium]